jgi:hypothetical protein
LGSLFTVPQTILSIYFAVTVAFGKGRTLKVLRVNRFRLNSVSGSTFREKTLAFLESLYAFVEAAIPVLNAIGFGYVAIQFIFGIPEVFGHRLYLSRPFLRRNGVKYDAVGVTIIGIGAAVITGGHILLSGIPTAPGVPAMNFGWFFFYSLETLFALAFGPLSLLLLAIANTMNDIFTGALAAWSISGIAYSLWFPQLLYRWTAPKSASGEVTYPEPMSLFTKRNFAIYVGLTLLWMSTRLMGPAAFGSVFKLAPPEVMWTLVWLNPINWFIIFPISKFILAPLEVRYIAPLLTRYGLTARQRFQVQAK